MADHRFPTFFKILLDPSSSKLPLPPEFITRHLKNKIPKNPTIRSETGGFSWRLKIKQVGEMFCFSDGWNRVVEEIELDFGDFLIFKFVDESTFELKVFSPNGCEKDFPQKLQVDCEFDGVIVLDDDDEIEGDEDDGGGDDGGGDDGGGGVAGDGDGDGGDGDPLFKTIITRTHRSILRLPAEFAKVVGIADKQTLTLKNPDGKEWQTVVRLETLTNYERYYVSGGWSNFRRSNGLLEGDKCVFKYIRSEEKLLLAKVNGETPASKGLKRKREQPSEISGKIPTRVLPLTGDHGGGVDREREEGVLVVKRPRGRPRKA